MALKITKEIQTDKGITSNAYVRIAGYFVTKYGGLSLALEVFKDQSDLNGLTTAAEINSVASKNVEIGQSLCVSQVDIAALENASIFSYGYGKLREKLEGLYGAENIINC